MDPYSILGVARGCTREQVKEAFRSRVHRAHPDRGGDGEAFVRLCAAYREVLGDLERGDGPPGGDPAAARADYVDWLRRVSEESSRRRPPPWWREHPERARACLLLAIGLCAVLVLVAALALGVRSPGRASRRGGPVRSSGPGGGFRIPDSGFRKG